MLIERVTRDGAVSVEATSVANLVAAGEIVVIRELLQQIGWFDRLVALCHAELAALVGNGLAKEVVESQFERIHDQLPVDTLIAFNRNVMGRISPLAPHLIKSFAHQVLGRRGTFGECFANVRTVAPHDFAAQHAAALMEDQRKRGAGKVTIHPPHYDSWHGHPLGTINLWCAVGPVRDGNGMLVYPDLWGKHLPSGDTAAVRRDQFLGPPVNFNLAPGDAIVFHANHLHGSEVNRTAATRCVISVRMTLRKPDFPGAHVFRYVYTDWIGTPLQRWARLPAQLSRDYLRKRAGRVLARLTGRATPTRPAQPQRLFPPDHDASNDWPAAVPARWEQDGRRCLIATGAVRIGEIRRVDARFCVARTVHGHFLFSRICPHEGADLAGGIVREDGRIACSWHNLTFDPGTGCNPCSTIAPLEVATGTVEYGAVRFELPADRPATRPA